MASDFPFRSSGNDKIHIKGYRSADHDGLSPLSKRRSLTSSKTESSKEIDDEIYTKLDADKLVDAYGTYGRYQLFGYFLCQFLNFPYAASVYVMNYIQMNPAINCTHHDETVSTDSSCWITNGTLAGDQCSSNVNTSILLKDTLPVTSIVYEYDLTCGHVFWKEAALGIFTVGALVTVPFMSVLADRYGRRPVILISLTIAILTNVVATFSRHFWQLLALRFVIGAASDTYYSVAAIATCEFLSSKCRAWISLVYCISWSCGMFWIGILSLFVTEWRLMYFAHIAPCILLLSYWFLLPESPHFLVQKKKVKQLKEYIETSNKWNGRAIDLHDCLADESKEKEEPQAEHLLHILRSPTVLKYLAINGFIQFTLSLYYFGISFLSVDLTEDKFTAYMLSAFVEIPGGLIVIPLMLYMGRRYVVGISLLLQGILITIAPFATQFGPQWMPIFFMLSGKLVNSVTYGVHPIYASEMVPTSVRSLCYSIMNVPQSLGIIAAPYFKHIETDPGWIRYAVVGGMCLLATISVCFLPETKDQALPPDIESLATGDTKSQIDENERDKLLSSLSDTE